MTLTALITLNAILGAIVVYGLVLLLGHGVRSDRAGVRAQVQPLPQRGEDRLAV